MGHHRQKRAGFNLIGSALETALGTLAASDEKYYNEVLQNVQNNERHIGDLLSQQI